MDLPNHGPELIRIEVARQGLKYGWRCFVTWTEETIDARLTDLLVGYDVRFKNNLKRTLMNSDLVSFHSILLMHPADAVLNNHRAYCARHGYIHTAHAIGSPGNSDRVRLLYKYSLARKIVVEAPAESLLIIADESAVVYEPLAADCVIGDAPSWIAQCAIHNRPDGCFFMLRAGPAALQWLDRVLNTLRDHDIDSCVSRWSHFELEGIPATPYDQSLEGAECCSLLFTPFGHNLPEHSAFVLSLNPTVHKNVHDDRVASRFVEYLNSVQARAGRLYDDIDLTPIVGESFEVVNPGRPVALITSYTPNIAAYAAFSERNVSAYCRRHDYTHYIYRDTPAHLNRNITGNWNKAELLLQHFGSHAYVGWIDADILIHSQQRPLHESVFQQPFTLVRDIANHRLNSGFMIFSDAPECRKFLEQVQNIIDAVPDKFGIYASGGDQAAFVSTWDSFGGEIAIPLSDCVSLNSHPSLYDADSFMIHYMGYPERFRAIVMRADSLEIDRRNAL
ncbi:glycosyltransferase family protein [Burkholderia paludis]|uniref:hypothetical protein n=1 Tax=Burkholderia paludis TaxID=1506587 RepID=UPI0009E070E4|nr:hypothetical protein [Burkholderia paludis]